MVFDIHKLSFQYGAELAIKGLSLQIPAAEFLAIVGPNGAGKSTLLKLLAGLIAPNEGSLEFMGKAVRDYKAPELARKIALVPQETHIVFPFTVEEIILMGRLPYNTGFAFDSAEDQASVEEMMELTETLELAAKKFNELSGGERQRVVLASALAQSPEVLLLDEPTVYLDMKHQEHFYDILERLNVEQNLTVVVVTHDINLAARSASKIVALKNGELIVQGLPEEVLTTDQLREIFEITATIIDRPSGNGKYVIPFK